MIPFAMAVHARTHKRVVMVCSAQSGKSETLLDIMGCRLDSAPVPTIYVGPSKQFITDQWEPRIKDLMENTPLSARCAVKSRQKITRKLINGVPLRLAHGGSSTAIKSDPFGLAITDEADEMMATLNGQGNPIGLVDARGDTHDDFVHVITSTPSEGSVDVEADPDSGLEFWSADDPEEIKSTIWRLWLTGSRYHWSWPCPHCGEYFIPRFQCLGWDKPKDEKGREVQSTPALAKKSAHLVGPCGCIIYENDPVTVVKSNYLAKEWMNENGQYVAPGQRVSLEKGVEGLPPESTTISYWVSGLCSPFVPWSDRAMRWVEAVRTGNPGDIQAVKNQGFGEVYAPGGGAVPLWGEVKERSVPEYNLKQVPDGVRVLTLAADVQKNEIHYGVRGWGASGTSWLIDAETLMGPTEEIDIWNDLASVLTSTYDGIPIRLGLVDSGYRPGKKFVVPEHRVYAFAKRFPGLVYATKGSSTSMRKPIVASKIDVKIDGKEYKKGLDLLRLDTDYFKSWVQQKVRWLDGQPGSWYLPDDISEDYCKQIVSESRVKTPGGKVRWIAKSKNNHFLDVESMQAAAAMMLNLSKLRPGPPQKSKAAKAEPAEPMASKPKATGKPKAKGLMGGKSIWG